ncbi:hypothetical protein [Chryseolinea sp. H1M3-3]|uniref:hypothetical protein n=1 Tax=Chryseolinea sp. H1M3-3 TaxID=3034144 RepID=UPI0023EB3A8D|nr:hypothetical protein [Chryseolinea sp. H1M3-3]
MEQLIIKKPRKKFVKRFVQTHILILIIFTLWGIGSFVVTDRPTKDNLEWGVFIITLCLSWSLLVRLLTVYHNEKKTITKLEIDDEGNLIIEYTDFDNMKRFVTSLDKLDVTLKRSYWQGGSRLNIDFWVDENKKLLRQHINTIWNGRDVKETFLMIKILKNSKLSKREKDMVDDEEFA